VNAPAAGDPDRLLAGWRATGRPARYTEHRARYGPLPRLGPELIGEVERAGLLGRGGAGFPTGRKLRAVAAGRNPVVLANGCEGDPGTDKDHALLELAPHLVLDGLQLAARAVGARTLLLCLHPDRDLTGHLVAALAERPPDEPRVELRQVPPRYVASEESALVNFVTAGDARPTAKPPRVFERGVDGRPTLVGNVETLAQLALIARYGADWFRGCGTPAEPGTVLCTVEGAVRAPAVYEIALGTAVGAVLLAAGGPVEPVQAVLCGGWGGGGWLPLPFAAGLPFTHAGLRAHGAALGVGSLLALPAAGCGLAETARLLRYLAGESAGQCGPCLFGLPAIAADVEQLVTGVPGGAATLDRLRRRLGVLPGRGACAHPDGAARLAASALRAVAPDVARHAAGAPCRWAGHRTLAGPARGCGGAA
jgi:NADH:ubiquinone oxidoreductase subunit F (NADH-binding)